MTLDGLAELASPELTAGLPLPFDSRPAAERLYVRAPVGVENLLPRHVKLAVVANIENAGGELVANVPGHAFVDRAIVSDWRLSADRCRRHAVEPDFERPLPRIGLLTMQWNVLVRGILGGRIDAGRYGAARRRGKFVTQ